MGTPSPGPTPAAPPDASVPRRRNPVVGAVTAAARVVAHVFGSARDGVARAILAAGLGPNAVTVVGPFVLTPVVVSWYLGHQRIGGFLLVAASAFDLLDGAVARLGGKVTKFGGFLDSVMDRYSDFLIFAGIFLWLIRHTTGLEQQIWLGSWALAVLGALLPAYVRARAETVIPLCKVGFLERAERTVTIFIGAIGGNLHLALLVVAVFGNLMSVERILYTREQLEPNTIRWGWRIWRHERLTPPHAVLCALLITFLLVGHGIIARP